MKDRNGFNFLNDCIYTHIYKHKLFPFSYSCPNTEHQTKLVQTLGNTATAALYYALQILW